MESALWDYYSGARPTTERMIGGETGQRLAVDLEKMRVDYNQLRGRVQSFTERQRAADGGRLCRARARTTAGPMAAIAGITLICLVAPGHPVVQRHALADHPAHGGGAGGQRRRPGPAARGHGDLPRRGGPAAPRDAAHGPEGEGARGRAAGQRGALRAGRPRRQRRPVGLGRGGGDRPLLAALEGDARPLRGGGAARHRGVAGARAPRRHRPRARPDHRPPRRQDPSLRMRVPPARPRRRLPLDAQPRRWRCAARTASPRAWPGRRPTSASASRTSSSSSTTPSTTR